MMYIVQHIVALVIPMRDTYDIFFGPDKYYMLPIG